MQNDIKKILANNESKISLTIDSWTSLANQSFCGIHGITCHFIDNHWKLKSFVLDFKPVKRHHSGKQMAILIYEVLKFYEVETRIQGITTDNASANTTLLQELAILIGPDFDWGDKHFLCFAHILNLAAQDFMKILKVECESEDDDGDENENDSNTGSDDYDGGIYSSSTSVTAVTKIRALLKKIKRSEQLQIKFKNFCQSINMNSTSPVVDVKTRWNSTHDMLQWSVKYKIPLNLMCDTEKNLKLFKIDEKNWSIIDIIAKYLTPFKTLSNILSGEKYCTLPLVVSGTNILLDKLEKWALTLDTDSRTSIDEQLILALTASRNKILKHYDKTNWIYCVSLMLDPRHKKDGFHSTTWGKNLEKQSVKNFFDIFNKEYAHNNIENNNYTNPTSSTSSIPKNEFDIDFSELFLQSTYSSTSSASETTYNTEIGDYFSTKQVSHNEKDIITWWKNHETIFPFLSKMTRDVLATSATSVPSERVFSRAALIIRKHRNRLNADSIRSLVCLNSWLDQVW